MREPLLSRFIERELTSYYHRILGALLVAIVFFFPREGFPVAPAALLVCGYLVYLLVLFRYLVRWMARFPWLAYAVIAVDCLGGTACLGVLGFDGPAIIIFPLLIAHYAISGGMTSSLVASGLLAFGYVAVVLANQERVVNWQPLAVQPAALLLLGLFMGQLAKGHLQEREEQEAMQHALEFQAIGQELSSLTREVDALASLDQVAEDVVQLACEAAEAPAAALYLFTESGRALVAKAARLSGRDRILGEHHPRVPHVARAALVGGDPRWIEVASNEDALPGWIEGVEADQTLLVPIAWGQQAYGLMYLVWPPPSRPPQDDQLHTLAVLGRSSALLFQAVAAQSSLEGAARSVIKDLDAVTGRVREAQRTRRRPILRVGGMVLYPTSQTLDLAGRELRMPGLEFALLYLLASHHGVPVSSEVIRQQVWSGASVGTGDNVLDVTIHRLRRRIEADPAHPKLIVTVRGRGYMLSSGE